MWKIDNDKLRKTEVARWWEMIRRRSSKISNNSSNSWVTEENNSRNLIGLLAAHKVFRVMTNYILIIWYFWNLNHGVSMIVSILLCRFYLYSTLRCEANFGLNFFNFMHEDWKSQFIEYRVQFFQIKLWIKCWIK